MTEESFEKARELRSQIRELKQLSYYLTPEKHAAEMGEIEGVTVRHKFGGSQFIPPSLCKIILPTAAEVDAKIRELETEYKKL